MIAYTKPSITSLEEEYAADAVKNGWGSRCYEYIDRFEEAFKVFTGSKYSIATSSCTGALHLGLAAMGIKENDEIIMADTNWVATASPIVQLKAKPVFIDVKKDTWCIDPKKIEEAITPQTKAIVAVHLYGNLCEMKEILDIGKRFNIPVIEDAAEAIGSNYHGKPAGSMGVFGAFSFHGTKTITTGEGGMFVTDNEEIYNKALTLSNHGRDRKQTKQFWPDKIGFKYKMSNVQAAIGCGQLERVESLIKKKQYILERYRLRLENKSRGDFMNPTSEEKVCGAWMPTLILNPKKKLKADKVLSVLKRNDIDARVFFWPLSMTPPFEATNSPTNHNSHTLYKFGFNLPSYHDLSDNQIDKIIQICEAEIKLRE